MSDKSILLNKWKDFAMDDLKVAQLSFSSGIYLQASFHCQQAIEKSLKGLYIYVFDSDPPYTHDLTRLYKLFENTKYYSESRMILFGGINPFYIQSRYPSYKVEVSKSLTKQKVESYINLSKEVIKWLEVNPT